MDSKEQFAGIELRGVRGDARKEHVVEPRNRVVDRTLLAAQHDHLVAEQCLHRCALELKERSDVRPAHTLEVIQHAVVALFAQRRGALQAGARGHVAPELEDVEVEERSYSVGIFQKPVGCSVVSTTGTEMTRM